MKLAYRKGMYYCISDKQCPYDGGFMRIDIMGLCGNMVSDSFMYVNSRINDETVIEITDAQFNALLVGFKKIQKMMELQRQTIDALFNEKQKIFKKE